jgi:O-antigen/teichoic acid export membrane protein
VTAATGGRGFGSRLAGDSLVYGLGGVANQAVAVLLVPIYARALGPEGVGITGVLNSTISLGLMLVGLALPQAFFRWYLRESTTMPERRHVLGTTLSIRIAASLLGLALILLAAVPLTAVLYAGDYVVISLARAAIGTILILALVVVAGTGVVGVSIGAAVAAAASAAIGSVALARSGMLRLVPDPDLARRMLSFALPLVPAGIAGWVLNLSDRPLLQAMTGSTETVGVYTMGYTAGLVINALVIQPFTLAWGAAFWEISRSDDAPRTFARSLTWFLAIAAGMALLLSVVATDILRFLVGPAFEQSRYVVPFSAFAFVLYGAYTIGASGLSVVGRSGIVAATMGAAAAVSLVLNLILIPPLGIFGAAISTLIGYLVLAVLSGWMSLRHYPVPWQLGRATAILATAGGLSALALVGPDHVLWRLGCLLLYVPILLGTGVVRTTQGRQLLEAIRRR